MSHIVLCNRLGLLQPLLPPAPAPLRFLILDHTRGAVAIRTHLRQRGGAEEVPLAAVHRARSTRLRAAYVEAIGRLNAECASLRWWAMPFTTKNPIATSLCRETFAFLLIAELVLLPGGPLVVATSSTGLAEQVLAWARTRGIGVRNAVRPAWDTIRWVNTRLPLLALAARVVRAMWFAAVFRARRFLPDTGAKLDILLVTLVHPSSVPAPGQFRDTYFGRLGEWLRERYVVLRVAGIVDGLSVKLARAFCARAHEQGVLPFDALPRVGDILRSARKAYGSYLESKSSVCAFHIEGTRIDVLVRRAEQEAHTSGNVFFHFCVYHAARNLAAAVQARTCLYPYENKAIEKMLLLGFREGSPRTKLIGYQHASVTPSHTNFMLADKEQDVVPLPDKVVTMGTVTRDWLIREGRHAPDQLVVGCALRRANPGAAAPQRRPQPHRLLVALATNLEEYVRVLLFLREAVSGDGWDIVIRPHPTISLSEASRLLPGGSPGFPHVISKESLADDLGWADVVLYASSTVGLEAIGSGMPAIYMDLGDILGTDPMDGWTEFKWVVREPQELTHALDDIAQLSDDQYKQRQQAGYDYVQAYLHPVTDSSLQAFLQLC